MLLQQIYSQGDFITFHEPGIIIEAYKIISAGHSHKLVSRRHIPQAEGALSPGHLGKASGDFRRAIGRGVIDDTELQIVNLLP